MDRHLALLHFDRLEVVLHCGGQVWCYLFVNHHLDISTFVCLVGLVKVYLCLCQAVVPILALAQVCLRHQLLQAPLSRPQRRNSTLGNSM